jgi:CRP/FNR family transcriptional regulator, cyclic AMP receptor protein
MTDSDADHDRSFLDRLNADEVAALRRRAVARHFDRGATLMHQDEVPGRLMVLEQGHVKVATLADDGKEVILAFRGPGDLLGEISALGGDPRCATVRALEPVDALAMAAAEFDAFLEDHPRVALAILRVVITRLREADNQQFEFGAYQTLGRVAKRLVDLAERFGEPCELGVRISLSISQEELAGWAGASREATSKALHDLRAMSLIETERRHITVRSVDELRRVG